MQTSIAGLGLLTVVPPAIIGTGSPKPGSMTSRFPDTVDRLWQLYNAAWRDQSIYLKELFLRAEALSEANNRDVLLEMLVGSLRRDLAE
jgi:hypothetical protein